MNRGTYTEPWICFGSERNTGVAIVNGEIAWCLNGIRVDMEEWLDGVVAIGHLNAFEALLLSLVAGGMDPRLATKAASDEPRRTVAELRLARELVRMVHESAGWILDLGGDAANDSDWCAAVKLLDDLGYLDRTAAVSDMDAFDAQCKEVIEFIDVMLKEMHG